MPRRWKKQTFMFVFVMTAMTSTILAMKKVKKRKELPAYVILSSSGSESEVEVMVNEVARKKQKNTPSTKSSEDSETGFKMKSISKDLITKIFDDLDEQLKNKVAQSTHSEMHNQNDDDDLDLNEDQEELYDNNVGGRMAQSTDITGNEYIERYKRFWENNGETEDVQSTHSEIHTQSNDDDVPFCSDEETDNGLAETGKVPVFKSYDKGHATNTFVDGKPLVHRAEWEKHADFGNRHALKKRQQSRCSQNRDPNGGKRKLKQKINGEFQDCEKTQARKVSNQYPLNRENNGADKDGDFDINGLVESNSSDANDSEDLQGVKKVKNENLFATFLEEADLVKYTLVNAKHKWFIERIPVTLSDGMGWVSWNVNAETVLRLHFGLEIKFYQAEMLKFVNDVFSRVPEAETPTNYNFYFDTTGDYRNWFMLAIHKRKNVFIGRQWKCVSLEKNDFQTSSFEPCDVQKKLIKKASDGICKLLLADGFHFPRDRKNKIQKNSENDIQCALAEKLDKSVKFLLIKYSDMTETAFKRFCLNDLCLPKESLKSKNFVPNEKSDEKEPDDRYVVSEDDFKKTFRNNLCESFSFMMKSKNWPARWWEYALESEHKPSKNMLKMLLERIKSFPKAKHLEILLKTNEYGKTAFFNKLLLLAQDESTSRHLDFLKILKFERKQVRAHVYQRLLFSGAVKPDLNVVKFALKNGASLQEKTSIEAAIQIANNFCWCKKERSQEAMENNPNDKICLHLKLKEKTALEIATVLEKDGLERGSNKKSFKSIKHHLEEEKNKEKIQICLEIESEHAKSDLETESKHDDDSKKRKRDE